ncbi:hypothetical protein BpHYR1_012471 [Brachionus plicatilis]|uniref:Uncharacterized protein n=1 Tax=Brachionus plicatilis TaxID=10195 RepID=A0A3M7Q281_BRAPC|nr:hypothetical protein BpHYR1_012471 [Brachionus plicatilis]
MRMAYKGVNTISSLPLASVLVSISSRHHTEYIWPLRVSMQVLFLRFQIFMLASQLPLARVSLSISCRHRTESLWASSVSNCQCIFIYELKTPYQNCSAFYNTENRIISQLPLASVYWSMSSRQFTESKYIQRKFLVENIERIILIIAVKSVQFPRFYYILDCICYKI